MQLGSDEITNDTLAALKEDRGRVAEAIRCAVAACNESGVGESESIPRLFFPPFLTGDAAEEARRQIKENGHTKTHEAISAAFTERFTLFARK